MGFRTKFVFQNLHSVLCQISFSIELYSDQNKFISLIFLMSVSIRNRISKFVNFGKGSRLVVFGVFFTNQSLKTSY